MLRVLSDKVLKFDRGERDNMGNVIAVKTKIGFCQLPEWVQETEFFKLAVKDGCIKVVGVDGDAQNARIAELEAELADMKAKQDSVSTELTAADLVEEVKPEKPVKSGKNK